MLHPLPWARPQHYFHGLCGSFTKNQVKCRSHLCIVHRLIGKVNNCAQKDRHIKSAHAWFFSFYNLNWILHIEAGYAQRGFEGRGALKRTYSCLVEYLYLFLSKTQAKFQLSFTGRPDFTAAKNKHGQHAMNTKSSLYTDQYKKLCPQTDDFDMPHLQKHPNSFTMANSFLLHAMPLIWISACVLNQIVPLNPHSFIPSLFIWSESQRICHLPFAHFFFGPFALLLCRV